MHEEGKIESHPHVGSPRSAQRDPNDCKLVLQSGREIDASQAGRLGRLSNACSALSLARSDQAERDNESCFFVHAAGVHRFIRRYHVKTEVRGNNAWDDCAFRRTRGLILGRYFPYIKLLRAQIDVVLGPSYLSRPPRDKSDEYQMKMAKIAFR
ncbi:hypothetical protein EVAR_63377_1 [Eumeta japonica]|uniref:Uncharacterized protein n=1 Tax=Eumeta variegata TaxID=151549 RepID=A0A4C1YQ88_EUMVA|nr:hypothetical protein EVAR_63377_1 [Eumeta japonica]